MKKELRQVYDKVIDCLEKERNIGRKIDIFYMIAALDKSFELNEHLYSDFLKDIIKKIKYITYMPDDTGGYTNGKIILEMENESCFYEIQFMFKFGGIDEWDAPRVKVFKHIILDDYSWDDSEESYLEFREKCNVEFRK